MEAALSTRQGPSGRGREQGFALPRVARRAHRAVELEGSAQLLVRLRPPTLGHETLRRSQPGLRLFRPRTGPVEDLGGGDEVTLTVGAYRLRPRGPPALGDRVLEFSDETEVAGSRREDREVDEAELDVRATAQGVDELAREWDGAVPVPGQREHVRAGRQHEVHGLRVGDGSTGGERTVRIVYRPVGVVPGQAHLGADGPILPGVVVWRAPFDLGEVLLDQPLRFVPGAAAVLMIDQDPLEPADVAGGADLLRDPRALHPGRVRGVQVAEELVRDGQGVVAP